MWSTTRHGRMRPRTHTGGARCRPSRRRRAHWHGRPVGGRRASRTGHARGRLVNGRARRLRLVSAASPAASPVERRAAWRRRTHRHGRPVGAHAARRGRVAERDAGHAAQRSILHVIAAHVAHCRVALERAVADRAVCVGGARAARGGRSARVATCGCECERSDEPCEVVGHKARGRYRTQECARIAHAHSSPLARARARRVGRARGARGAGWRERRARAGERRERGWARHRDGLSRMRALELPNVNFGP
jgi:hypothetical protein